MLAPGPTSTDPLARPRESIVMRICPPAISCLALVLAALASPASALTLERDFRIDPARLVVSTANGVTAVDARGGTHEYATGRPDLPWIAERIDLPAGMKVTNVEVVSAATELVRDGVRVAPARSSRPGAADGERTAADARVFASTAF